MILDTNALSAGPEEIHGAKRQPATARKLVVPSIVFGNIFLVFGNLTIADPMKNGSPIFFR
ncbi:MAG: hypothetical protein M2R45_02518 [Verrucomicrobia subdivision 3 bacterium]|nr:hypothetical protein [Limisphaerales bacterium]MCS1414275.1 hypothetical protein [Limisphaerales bacterium]